MSITIIAIEEIINILLSSFASFIELVAPLLLILGLAAFILLIWENRSLKKQLQAREAALRQTQIQNEKLGRHRIDFLAAMSHDIRTPLAGVIGMLKFALRDSTIADRTGEYLRIGLKNSEALLAILNDLLDFSRIDAGRLSINTQDLDLIDIIDEAITILRPQADAKALLLRCELAPGLPRHVQGDPNRIRKMIDQTRALKSYRGQPILFNEDDHFNFDKPDNNFLAALSKGAGWGYFDFRMQGEGFDEGFQSVPVNWQISSARKRGFFDLLSQITGENR